ncbi:RraA family protein [Variovorax dokdonensis]|uniref:Putative 4-hydroxy-4-methyl-2-oxoglutarate aldolase n=1 Tax=Variovorax dokdonensis TaxID=344883 RepID=A0ABT7NAV3_9BURK|nr:RraA family protein [Variovorax dokdonensis]MDM0045057.1 RraA family protein [Variovorax dokdonensis]
MNENFTINEVSPAPRKELVDAFLGVPTSHISDNQRRLEGILGLRRFHRSRKLIGTAVTVKVRAGDNLLTYKALSMISPGHVLVVDAGGVTNNAIVGELLMTYAQQRGCAGFVVDGAIRDSAAFLEADFPCYAREATHRGPFKTGPGSINVPVSIGGQVVQPGDVIVGDEDGLVVFAPSEADRLMSAAERTAAAERAIRDEILTGNVRQSWMDKMFAAHGLG